MQLAELVARFRGPAVPDGKGGFMVFCPAHDDGAKSKRRSLHVSQKGEQKLVHCFATCLTPDVLAKVGLSLRDLMPEASDNGPAHVLTTYEHPYRDEQGVLLFRVVRKEFSDGSKTFTQSRPDGQGGWLWKLEGVRRVLYRLPELRAEVRASKLPRGWCLIVEGDKHADRLRALGIPATTNAGGAGKWLPDYYDQLQWARVTDPVLTLDWDPPGWTHMAAVLQGAKGFDCRWLQLPGLPPKGDILDWLDAGHTTTELVELVTALPVTTEPGPQPTTERRIPSDAVTETIRPVTLAEVHAVFQKWLGPDYDLEVLDAALAAAACERLGGDPPWLMLISGSGAGKTETVQALEGAGAHVISMISSVGSLLSGSAKREIAKDATGGLLRRVGDRGILVLKDATSILTMDRTNRAAVLAALREIHDGKWVREIGTDGGRSLTWEGRVVVIGACTSAWDRAHEAVSTMGDRFVLIRVDSSVGRHQAFTQAMKNSGHEKQMRKELAAAVGGLLAAVDPGHELVLTPEEEERFFNMANLVTLARTAVDTDYREDVLTPHAPEMPTRYGKQLWQLVRGATAIGLSREDALNLAGRCAHDTVPPVRMAILNALAQHPESSTSEIAQRANLPWNTVKRQLDSLKYLGLILSKGEDRNIEYWLRAHINPDCLYTFSISTNVSSHTREPGDETGQPEPDPISTFVSSPMHSPPF